MADLDSGSFAVADGQDSSRGSGCPSAIPTRRDTEYLRRPPKKIRLAAINNPAIEMIAEIRVRCGSTNSTVIVVASEGTLTSRTPSSVGRTASFS
ncbi:MAG TPA: hypothetical protein VIJ87_06835 [Pyrinomonadaceae bacterium]